MRLRFEHLLLVGLLGCRTAESTPPADSQSAATDDVDPIVESVADPAEVSGVHAAIELIGTCDEARRLDPVLYAWTKLCEHSSDAGADVAAQQIEACRVTILERMRIEHPPGPGERFGDGLGSVAFEAGLREAWEGEKYDLRMPLSLDACAP